MQDFNVVDVLNTGVTGFAFLMMFVGYKLLSSLQTAVIDKKMSDFQSLEFFKEWQHLVEGQQRNTRYFMLFATALFVGGLALLFYRPENDVVVSITPREGELPEIRLQGQVVKLADDGHAMIRVKSEHNIDVNLTKIALKIIELTNDNRNLHGQLTSVLATERQAPDAGL